MYYLLVSASTVLMLGSALENNVDIMPYANWMLLMAGLGIMERSK